MHATAPSSSSQFSHHISLLSSRSDSQRKESLSFLVSNVPSHSTGVPLQLPLSAVLPKLLPLTLDGSNGVRSQLLKLLKALPSSGIEDHVDYTAPYVRAGMTHLSPEIRSSSMDILEWLLSVAGQELVSSAGGWIKFLKAFLVIFRWSEEVKTPSSWSVNKSSAGKLGSDTKGFVKSLYGLSSFLRAGLLEPTTSTQPKRGFFPVQPYDVHLLHSRRSNTFGYLNLFGLPKDADSQIYEDYEERQRVFHTKFRGVVERGLDAAKREGGEVGRAAATVRKVINEGMEGFELDDLDETG